MSLWVCTKCGTLTGGSRIVPCCAKCGSLEVSRADIRIDLEQVTKLEQATKIYDNDKHDN